MKKQLICIITMVMTATAVLAQKKLLSEAPGVVSYTFRDSFVKSVPATLDKIKAMGITNIEFSSLFGQTPAGLRAMLDERGMQCTSYGVGYGDLEKNADEVIKTAKILGATFIRVASIPHPGKFDDLRAETVKKAAGDFNRFGKKLNEAGLTFCYHNHGPEFKPAGELGEGTFFDYLIKNTDARYVSFEMDVAWVYWPGIDPVALLKKYKGRFKLMHVKNVKKGLERGGRIDFVAVGEGQIDMAAVLKAGQKGKVKYFYIEDESPQDVVDGQVVQSVKFMQGLSK
jgi:sugar phosphate isomerase/epimerase